MSAIAIKCQTTNNDTSSNPTQPNIHSFYLVSKSNLPPSKYRPKYLVATIAGRQFHRADWFSVSSVSHSWPHIGCTAIWDYSTIWFPWWWLMTVASVLSALYLCALLSTSFASLECWRNDKIRLTFSQFYIRCDIRLAYVIRTVENVKKNKANQNVVKIKFYLSAILCARARQLYCRNVWRVFLTSCTRARTRLYFTIHSDAIDFCRDTVIRYTI